MNNSVECKNIGVDWIGSIPSNWKVSRFKHLFDEKKSTKTPELNSGSISFGQVIYKNDESIPESTKEGYQEVLEGEFLINPLNLNYDLKSLRIALSRINVVVSQGYFVLKLRDHLHPNYYEYLLRKFDVEHMKSLGQGVRQTISFTHLKDENLVVPPIEEQKLISRYLNKKTSQVDSLVEKIQKKIEFLKEQRTSLINHYVTKGLDPNVEMKDSGIEWIGEIPSHFELTKLKFIFDEKKSTPNPDLNSGSISFGKVIYKDDEKILESTKNSYQEVLEGEFLLNPLNLNYDLKSLRIGRSRINVVVSQGYIVLKMVESHNPDYLEYLLRKFDVVHMKSLGQGVRQTISYTHLKDEFLVIPPVKEQEKIVNFLNKETSYIDCLCDIEKKRVLLLTEYRQSLISSVVTGKVRVTEDMI